MQIRNVINFSFAMILLTLSLNVALASEESDYPMGVTPTHVYELTNTMNAYVDAIAKKDKLDVWQKVPQDIEKTIRPMVVFQLCIAIVELLHDYELKEGLRPIPIITSSPIEYYPADVKYVIEMILERLKRLAEADKIFHVSTPKPIDGAYTPFDVYKNLLVFYMKIAALDGDPKLDADHNYSQMHRADEEMQSIILKASSNLKSAIDRRLLVSSTIGMHPTGPRVEKAKMKAKPRDVFIQCLEIRKLMNAILKKHGMSPIPIPIVTSDKPIDDVDVFIQSQIIISELSELKRILGVADSSPVTKQASGKSNTDVLQQALSLKYMLDRYKTVVHDSHH